MRRVLVWLGLAAGAVAALVVVAVVLAAVGVGGGHLERPVTRQESFGTPPDLPRLHVDGARLVTEAGAQVTLTGVMPPDPAVLDDGGRFNAELFEEIAATGANVVRIPVHPHYWSDDPDYLWRYLDPAVRWAGEAGMYAIIDWHSIGNVRTGRAPLDPELYSHTAELTGEFWAATARYFADAPHVLLEVFNEPQGISDGEWRAAAQELVGTIRAQGADQPVIVGGTDYGKDLSWVLDDPLDDPAVVYASHLYPAHDPAGWDRYVGQVAAQHPVLLTEWGFTTEPAAGQAYLAGRADGYGRELMDYADELGAGWVACWWDDTWQPAMLLPGNREVGDYGRFVLDELATP